MLTSDAFLDALRRLKLVDTEQLSILESDQSSISSRELARDLIAKDLLTPYQVNQLFAGKGEDLLLGSFVLLERLGEGGMGQVFKARNWKLDHIVALKIIREDSIDSHETIRRFQREIQAVSQLTHPNIVHALDAEESNGRWFLAMEFVEGMDLKQKVSQSGPLSVPAACDAIWQAALGLQHAHERGLVHRDIKPSNLLITDPQKNYPHGQVKILDLGLARFTSDSEDTTLTVEGAIMGTPDYLAPEQGEESHQVDIRADIYSLGCSLYCLLIGEPPFPGGNFMQKLRKHLTQEPVPVEERRSGVPKELGEVVRKMMRKSPGDRYQTPWEVAQALEQAVIPTATPVASRQKPVSPFAGLDEDTIPKEEPADPRKLVWLVALPLVALLGWGLSFLFRGEPGQTASTKPKPLVPPADRAQEDFDKLRRRAHTVGEDQRRLRLDLLSFRRQHFQRPDLCVTVATWLRSMSTPLDRLKALRALNVTQGGKGIERIEIVRFLGTPTWRAWGGCNSLSASRDGSRVVGGTGQGFQIWDESGNPVFYQAVSNGALDVELSPEGELLAVASGSHHLSLWDLSTPRQISRQFAHEILIGWKMAGDVRSDRERE